MRIVYCENCDIRVSEEDIESGKAYTNPQGDTYCAACSPSFRPRAAKSATSAQRIVPAPHDAPARAGRRTPTGAFRVSQPQLTPSSQHLPATHVPAASPLPIKWIAAGSLSALTIIVAIFAFRGKAPETPPARQPLAINPTINEHKTELTPAQTPKTPERAHGLLDDMANERARGNDPGSQNAAAAARLQAARDFYARTPQDPWAYLDLLRQVPADTPPGKEAAKAIAELKMPLDKSETPGWYRDWNFTNKDPLASVAMLYDFDGRKNVLQTQAPRDGEVPFNAKPPVARDKGHFGFSVRGEDKGLCKIAIEVDGKQQLLEEISGSKWRDFDIDLDYFKGREAAIQIRHIAAPSSSSAYWTPPVFRAGPAAGVKSVAYNPKALPYDKNRIDPPKHTFVALTEWKESPAWKTPVNLLALADPATGAVAGEWKRDDKGAILSGKLNGARMAIDYKLPNQYDIKAVFERKGGNSDTTLILAQGKHQFVWQMGAEQNKNFDLALVAGKKFDGNPACVKNGDCLKNNKRYTTLVEVRKDRVSAYLDGKLITEWTADMGELSRSDTWKLPDGKTLGIGAFQSEVTFYSLELVEVK
ncbi:MAG TPA: hypothetical protein VKX17_21095 [Planctomycetota bacterium]|nr:hypothetical protein [Planctomycetota bacterium]